MSKALRLTSFLPRDSPRRSSRQTHSFLRDMNCKVLRQHRTSHSAISASVRSVDFSACRPSATQICDSFCAMRSDCGLN